MLEPTHHPTLTTPRACATFIALALAGCAPAKADPPARRLLAGPPVAGGCLPGIVTVCEDPVSGASPQADVDAGTFLPDGWRVDEKGNHITFDFGEDLVAGTVRFTITGIGPMSLEQDTLLLLLATDTPELKNPAPTRVLELKIWGSAVDPNASGNTRFGAGDTAQEAVKSAGILDYDPNETYEFQVSWDDETQWLQMTLDGEVLIDMHTGDLLPGPDNEPIAMRYRYVHLAMPYLGNPAFWPIIDGVYGSVAIGATPASGEPPPTDGTSEGGDPGEPDASDGLPGSSDAGQMPDDDATSGSTGVGDDTAIASDDGDADTGDPAALPLPGVHGDEAGAGCGCSSAQDRSWPAGLFGLGFFALRRGRRRRTRPSAVEDRGR